MPTDPHSNWTHLCVFLGLDVGFDARRRRAGHAAFVDGVLANCGGGDKENKVRGFNNKKERWNVGPRRETFLTVGLSNVFVKAGTLGSAL